MSNMFLPMVSQYVQASLKGSTKEECKQEDMFCEETQGTFNPTLYVHLSIEMTSIRFSTWRWLSWLTMLTLLKLTVITCWVTGWGGSGVNAVGHYQRLIDVCAQSKLPVIGSPYTGTSCRSIYVKKMTFGLHREIGHLTPFPP